MKSLFSTIDLDWEVYYGRLPDYISIYKNQEFPNWKNSDIVIFGIKSSDEENEGSEHAPDAIRKNFYKLYAGEWSIKISDLGNINTVDETALQNIFEELLFNNKKIILLGGSQKHLYIISKSIQTIQSYQNISIIDSEIDLTQDIVNPELNLNHKNYLNYILGDAKITLNNISLLGLQTYYNSQDTLNYLNKLYIDSYFLRELKNNINYIEPELRDSHIISIDVNSLENSYFPAQKISRPNGFNGLDICKIARLSGLSDKNKIFGIFEMNPFYDKNELGANLSAQILWYFIEGKNKFFQNNEQNKENLLKFYVNLELVDLIFYKDENTERWWVEFKNLNLNNKIFACSLEDYNEAINKRLSKRLIRLIEKNTL